MYRRKATREGSKQSETQFERGKRRCYFLRDVSSMQTEVVEPEVGRYHVTSSEVCADDVNVLDAIETCHGVRPVLLSDHFIGRRQAISGIQVLHVYEYISAFFSSSP